ncbi:hypothetical protein F511_10808 [Dorcoceras hygrometricum]|uniref:Uncharacterized protein n=1 Tax=Dorcoceras hygrometricum TaxID=472368 RepID=A0A2Z7C0D4_9LAMI|nr:hypothetical protein F511_10808 [Dorcoceras hygrometricum]
MSSPDYNLVDSLAESIDLSSPPEASLRGEEIPSTAKTHRDRILRIDQDEARLAARGCTWYEIKACTLRQSDIPVIRDKAGISELYEIVLPHVHARAHCPPAGFHTFYVNQIERGLRFPVPRFITDLCNHLKISPSQLTPNSFSSLLSLGILLKFFRIPLSTYTLMRLVQIKRLGPGKFYISNQCVSGNPSSHKGWMSRYFFIKRISSRENPWGCDMSWRDNAYTQPPSTPEPAPELTDFLKVTREKCFNAQELIEKDLLCHFKFSGKGVPLVGDLGERMSKAKMLRALKERKADPEGASRSLSKGKRKSTEERGEKRKKRQHEQENQESGREPVSKEAIKETSTSGGKGPEQTTKASCEYLDASTISFIAKPSGSASLDFTRHLIPDRDYNLVNSVPDLAALEAASLHLMQAVVWSGSVANRLLRAREEITETKHSMDGVLQEHGGLMKQLEEIRANHDKESEEMALKLESSRTRALRAEEENKALQAEVDKWKDEAANSWELGKEKFLQSKEFRILCSGKALAFFEKGFDECLAQFRESGYTEEEHPASFLDVERALANLPDDEEEEGSSSGREEAPPS